MSRKDFVAGYMAAQKRSSDRLCKKAMPWPSGGEVPPLEESGTWERQIDPLGCTVYVGELGKYWGIIYEDADYGKWGGWLLDKSDFPAIDVNAPFDVYDQNLAVWKADPVHNSAGSAWGQLHDYFKTHKRQLSGRKAMRKKAMQLEDILEQLGAISHELEDIRYDIATNQELKESVGLEAKQYLDNAQMSLYDAIITMPETM